MASHLSPRVVFRSGIQYGDDMPGAKILIVDDEKVFADTLVQIFQNEGYECRSVYSAEQALETILSWEPDLTIVDVMLPGMNGIDLAIQLKGSHPSVAVMMISGQLATGALMEEAASSGHKFSVLAKPFPIPELLSGASRILGATSSPGAPPKPASFRHPETLSDPASK